MVETPLERRGETSAGGRTMKLRAKAWSGAIVLAAIAACGGSSGAIRGGAGSGSALCGINGSDHCGMGQQCDAQLGCVDCEANSDCPQSAPYCVPGVGQCA